MLCCKQRGKTLSATSVICSFLCIKPIYIYIHSINYINLKTAVKFNTKLSF